MTFSESRSYTNPLFNKVREIQQLKRLYEFLSNSLPDDLKGMFKLN